MNKINESDLSLQDKEDMVSEITRKVTQIQKIKDHREHYQDNDDFILPKRKTQPEDANNPGYVIENQMYDAYQVYKADMGNKIRIRTEQNAADIDREIKILKEDRRKKLNTLSDHDIQKLKIIVLERQKPRKPEELDMNNFSYKDKNEYALMTYDKNNDVEEGEYEEKIKNLRKEQERFKDDETIIAAFDVDIAKLEDEMKKKSKNGKEKLEENIKIITEAKTYNKFTEIAKDADQNIEGLETTKERLDREIKEEKTKKEEEEMLDRTTKEQFPTVKKYIEVMKDTQGSITIQEIFEHPDTINPLQAITYLE